MRFNPHPPLFATEAKKAAKANAQGSTKAKRKVWTTVTFRRPKVWIG